MSSSLALPFSHIHRFPNVSSSRASSALVSPSLASAALASASAPGLSLGAPSLTNSSRQRNISHIGRVSVPSIDGGLSITDGGREMHLHGLGMKLIGRGQGMGNPNLLNDYMDFVYSKAGVNADNSDIKKLYEKFEGEEDKMNVIADDLKSDLQMMDPWPHKQLDWPGNFFENSLHLAFGIYVDDSDVKKLVERYDINHFEKYQKELLVDALGSDFRMTVRLQILYGKLRGTDLVSMDFDSSFRRWLQEFIASEPTDPLIQKFVSLFKDKRKLPEGIIVITREEGYVLRMSVDGKEVGQTQDQVTCVKILKPFLKKCKSPRQKLLKYLFS